MTFIPNYTKETIGVIGGCGVAAANELMCRIERKLTELGCVDDSQQPEIILFQATLAPNRIAFAAGKSGTSFAPRFIDVGRKLRACGATICCIPCNTAHCVIDEIENAVGVPFVNVISETLHHISTTHCNAKAIGILGSSGTKFSRIYQVHASILGLDCKFLFPSGQLQQTVDGGIAAVKSGLQYTSPEQAYGFFANAAVDLIAQGADVIVLGCTEIPLAVKDKAIGGKPVVDTISILAEACISRCKI
ncbi:MAG: amino acid racemase [Puniceicoccales bacterium]|jgi:aspartate racemase|nr:amino acid racemase [Puniceicoccales bacterium]